MNYPFKAKDGWQTEMKEALLAAHSPDSLAVVIVGWYNGAGGNTLAAAGWWNNGLDLSYQQAAPNTRYTTSHGIGITCQHKVYYVTWHCHYMPTQATQGTWHWHCQHKIMMMI